MGYEMDKELLAEFVSETGEIVLQLKRVLADLEQRPADCDLPGAVFRGFHTIKGAAGFFSLDPLVEICNLVEGAFDKLCEGRIVVDVKLLDAVSRALATVEEMMEALRGGEQPLPADEALLSRLKELNESDRPCAETRSA